MGNAGMLHEREGRLSLRLSRKIRSPQLAVLTAPPINTPRCRLLLFKRRLTGNAKPHPRNSLAAGFGDSTAAFITINGALPTTELAPCPLHFVFDARVNLILNGAIP